MTCRAAARHFGRLATELATYQTMKRAKSLYSERSFEKAFLYSVYAYMLGSKNAAKSLAYLLQSDRIGSFQRRGSLEEQMIIFDVFQVLRKPSAKLAETADYFYEGVNLANYPMERFSNALRLYKASKTIKDDSYTDFSIAMMTENGEGTAIDLGTAMDQYWAIMEQSLNGNRGGVFLPCLARIAFIYIKSFVRFVTFGLYFDSYQV